MYLCRQMNIKYLSNHQIDKPRWDKVVDNSPNGRIYGYSWYLDCLADDWGALVAGDYEYVFPLPFHKKHGIYCIVNPFFVQQLGIYSENKVNSDVYAEFFKAIPRRFRYIDICISLDEDIPDNNVKVVKRRTNFILDINRPYAEIHKGYRRDNKERLRKSFPFVFEESCDYEQITINYIQNVGALFPEIKTHNYRKFCDAMRVAQSRNCLKVYILADTLTGETLASGFFPMSHGRAYNIMSSQSEKGKQVFAHHFLKDCFIREHCQQLNIFDFEGSDLPGVAEFFKKWGGEDEPYTHVRLSRFPINFIR